MKPGNTGHMDEYGQRIAWLVAGHIRQTLTEEEYDELDAWINQHDDNKKLFEKLTDENNIQASITWMEKVDVEKSLEELKSRLAARSQRKKWILTAAASALLILTVAFLFETIKPVTKTQSLAIHDSILPGTNKATLELGNGQLVDLGIATIGKINNDAEKILDGQLAYLEKDHDQSDETHILRTPLGGQYQVQLSDGTKVWLNASSKISYPVRFNGSDRTVQLTGEAYFEVAEDKTKPFFVNFSNNSSVKVLGTHFNISSYMNESQAEVTLLEGSVQVSHASQEIKLAPGEQAQINATGIDKIRQVDTAEAVGWKDGYFIFRNAGIESIMRQLERWYGISTVYKTKPTAMFTATIYRKDSIDKLLRILEKTGKVHFNTVHKTVYILP